MVHDPSNLFVDILPSLVDVRTSFLNKKQMFLTLQSKLNFQGASRYHGELDSASVQKRFVVENILACVCVFVCLLLYRASFLEFPYHPFGCLENIWVYDVGG